MDVKLMIAFVQAYIYHRKEVNVDLNVQAIAHDPMQLMLLQQAYDYAANWFRNNGGNIERLR